MKADPIPISAAKRIADVYGYDQVIIIARKVDPTNGMEHVTTYGINKVHCNVAARIGEYIKYQIMRWNPRDDMLAKTVRSFAKLFANYEKRAYNDAHVLREGVDGMMLEVDRLDTIAKIVKREPLFPDSRVQQ